MAVTTLLGLPIPSMSETVGKTIPDLASAMQIIDEKLGGSRIVDHNLDVANPPNGYYWRREDGVQVCWREAEIDFNITGAYQRRNYPAAMLSSHFVYQGRPNLLTVNSGAAATATQLEQASKIELTGESWLRWRMTVRQASTDVGTVGLFAIGRWK